MHCNLRFDDTNPTKEDIEYVNSNKNDVEWHGFNWDSEVKLVDTQDLKSCAFNGRAGSIPAPGTNKALLMRPYWPFFIDWKPNILEI